MSAATKKSAVESARAQLINHSVTVKGYCADGTALPFLLGAALLDYLSKLVAGEDKKGPGYKSFINDYLSRIRPEYKSFCYLRPKRCPRLDINEHMY